MLSLKIDELQSTKLKKLERDPEREYEGTFAGSLPNLPQLSSFSAHFYQMYNN